MNEQKPTTEKLAEALLAAHAPADMVKRARSGHYDDYPSDVADPIRALVNDARRYGLENIAQRAMAGEFDGTREESEAWRKSADGQATFAEFLSPKKKKGK